MRMMLAAVLAAWGWRCRRAGRPCVRASDGLPAELRSHPGLRWIDPTALPLYSTYRWPGLAGIAVTATNPRFRFEEACASPPVPDDPRAFAVAARAAVPQPDGQWQLQVLVMHWRGETWRGGQLASRSSTRRWPPCAAAS